MVFPTINISIVKLIVMKKIFSARWWYDNIRWIWRKVTHEVNYCLRWFISLTPGALGRYLRRNYWGIGTVGKNVTIDEGCWVSHPEKLILGKNVGVNKGSRFNAAGKIKIGNNCLIGPEVIVWSQNHNFTRRDVPINMQECRYLEVILEEDVWVAARATILPGVRIGKGAIVSAGAVVTKDVAPYTIVAGVPAQKIKDRVAASGKEVGSPDE